MNKTNKNLLKHLLAIFSLGLVLFLLWACGLYAFLCIYIEKEVFPTVEQSRLLSEMKNNNFHLADIKAYARELEKNKYICRADVIVEDNRLLTKEKTSFINTLFKFPYPVEDSESMNSYNDYIEVCPSFAMLDKILSDKFVLFVMFSSVIILLLIICFMFYIYINRYIVSPFNQIKAVVDSLLGNNRGEINKLKGYGIWKDLFISLNRLNNKIFDIDTTIKLLISAVNMNGAEFEFVNTIQLFFDIIRKKIPTSRCLLLVPENNDKLRIVAKSGFFKKNISFIEKDKKNYIWNCYENCLDKIINNISDVDKINIGDFYDQTVPGSFACLPMLKEDDNLCIGVFVVISDLPKAISYDAISLLKVAKEYFVALMNKMEYYKKIEERSIRFEQEGQFARQELINKNVLVTKRMKNISAVLDIFSFVLTKIEMKKIPISDVKEIIEFIITKSKETFGVKHAGILYYDKDKKELRTVYNSFGLKKEIVFLNEKGSIYSKILETGKGVFINNNDEAEKHKRTKLFETVNVIYSAVFLPIKNKKGDIVAFFGLVNKIGEDFNAIDMKFSEYIAIIISGMLKSIN